MEQTRELTRQEYIACLKNSYSQCPYCKSSSDFKVVDYMELAEFEDYYEDRKFVLMDCDNRVPCGGRWSFEVGPSGLSLEHEEKIKSVWNKQ